MELSTLWHRASHEEPFLPETQPLFPDLPSLWCDWPSAPVVSVAPLEHGAKNGTMRFRSRGMRYPAGGLKHGEICGTGG